MLGNSQNLWVSVGLWSSGQSGMSAGNHYHDTIAVLDGERAVKRDVTCTNTYIYGEVDLSKSLEVIGF